MNNKVGRIGSIKNLVDKIEKGYSAFSDDPVKDPYDDFIHVDSLDNVKFDDETDFIFGIDRWGSTTQRISGNK